MINYANQALFLEDSIPKELSITGSGVSISNSNIDGENFTLEEILNSGREVNFGQCNASKLSFSCGYYNKSIVGKVLTVTTTPEGGASFQFGNTYKVVSDEPTADRMWRNVVAYDALYGILIRDVAGWYNSFLPDENASKTLKQFRDSFFSLMGITQASVTLPNDNMIVKRTINPKQLPGKTVLNAMCQINGCFGRIGRNGNFQYVFLDIPKEGLFPSNTLYPSDTLYPKAYGFEDRKIAENGTYINLDYEDYLTQTINKLTILTSEDDVGVSVGSGNNAYVIQNNFLVFGKEASELTTIANNIFSHISGIWYRPCVIEAVGNPCLECGDGIMVKTTDNKDIHTIILKRRLKGLQSLKDVYTADGTKTRENDPNSLQAQMNQTQGSVRQVKADLIEAQTIIAEEIQADRARISAIEADYIKTAQLQAVDAKIDNLTAIAITTQNLSAQIISGNQISGGTISGVNINGLAINCTNIDTNGLTFRGTGVAWVTIATGETVLGVEQPI